MKSKTGKQSRSSDQKQPFLRSIKDLKSKSIDSIVKIRKIEREGFIEKRILAIKYRQ